MLALASLVAPRFETRAHPLALNYDRRFTRRIVDAPAGAQGQFEKRIIIDAAIERSGDSVEARRIMRLPEHDSLVFRLAIPERDGVLILRGRGGATGT
jgi:hypothetical protein